MECGVPWAGGAVKSKTINTDNEWMAMDEWISYLYHTVYSLFCQNNMIRKFSALSACIYICTYIHIYTFEC